MQIFFKTGIFAGFPLHNINFAERNSEAAMGRVGAEYVIFCRVPCSSLRVPSGPSSGLQEALVSGNNKLYFLADEYEAAKLRWAGGRAAPCLAWQCAKKDECAQRTGAHARPKPTSCLIRMFVNVL